MPDLGVGWVIRREMEVRSRRPSWYEGFAYEGLTIPALALALPFAVVLYRGHVTAEAFTWLMIPYALYLFFAAAGMASGGLAVDHECLRRLPVSAWTLLAGKLLGSLLNLWVELVLVSPLVVLAAGPRSAGHGLVLLGFLAWVVLYGGLLGVTWVRDGIAPRQSAQRARSHVSLLLVGLPVGVLLVLIAYLPSSSDLAGVWLLHPVGGLVLLCSPVLDGRLVAGIVLCAIVAGLLTLQALHRLRASLP